jgi:hypothetical protein
VGKRRPPSAVHNHHETKGESHVHDQQYPIAQANVTSRAGPAVGWRTADYWEKDMGKRKGKQGLTRRRREELRLKEEAFQALRRDARLAQKEQRERWNAAVQDALHQDQSVRVPAFKGALPHLPGDTQVRIYTRWKALAQVVAAVRPGLLDAPFVYGLEKLCLVDPVGKVADWVPKGRGLNAAFQGLAVHLLGEYWPSRNLLDCLLIPAHSYEESVRVARLVRSVAGGQRVFSLVGTSTLPAPLTRRMCHLLVNPARACALVAATRRAQVLAHGGGERLARILGEKAWASFGSRRVEAFRDQAIHWLCRQENLDLEKVERMTCYLDQRFHEDAGFQMKGRTVDVLMRHIAEWEAEQRELARIADQRDYEPSGFSARHWTRSRRVNGQDLPPDGYVIREIRNPRELVKEGTRMSNCVATYHEAVRNGRSSIWSLTRNGKSRMTIEVRKNKKVICEALGFANQDGRPLELGLLKIWAQKNGLRIPAYLLPMVEAE